MSQTSTFVKKLASNDGVVRDQAFETLKKYLSGRSSKQLSLLDFEKLWKGLYYSMWFCDKPKPQENLCESLGQLYSSFIPAESFAPFLEAFWKIMIKEWPGVDKWRVDKYLLLIRRVVRHGFVFLQKNEWDDKLVQSYLDVLERTLFSGEKNIPMALPYHVTDIYLDELEFVMFSELSDLQEALDDIDSETDDTYIAKFQELYKQKLEIAQEVPIAKLISNFENIKPSSEFDAWRARAKKDVLEDERMKEWGVIDDEDEEEGEDDDEKEEVEEDEDEWKGF